MRGVIVLLIGMSVSGFTAQAQIENCRNDSNCADAAPIEPPVPSYPPMALMLKIEGACSVRFSVDEEGHPFGLVTYCTEPVFCFESKRAVSEMRFAPAVVAGRPRIRHQIVYPLEYRMAPAGKPLPDKPENPCREVPVS